MLFSLTAGAWNYPQYETFLGCSFVRFNPNSPFIPSYNSNGGAGQVVYNFNGWFGAEMDAGGVNNGALNHFKHRYDNRLDHRRPSRHIQGQE